MRRIHLSIGTAMLFSAHTLFAAEVGSGATPVHSETLKAILNHDHPRLVVVMSFDQLRMDYLTRFSDLYLPASGPGEATGGFRYLMERGALFADAHYSHIP